MEEDEGSLLPEPRPAQIVPRRPPGLQAAPPYGMEAGAPPSDWQRYFLGIARHKWLVAVVTILGTAAGAIATRLLDPRYSAKTMLWIESGGSAKDPDVISGTQVVEASSWVELVTSNAVLDDVVRRLRLYVQPRVPADSAVVGTLELGPRIQPGDFRLVVDRRGASYELTGADGAVLERGTVGDSVGKRLGLLWAPPPAALPAGRVVAFTVIAPYEATQQLAKALRVRLDPGGTFLRIELKGTNAWLTTATANAIGERVVTVAAELKRQKFEELARILGEQYQHAQRTLQVAEAALTDFHVRTAGVVQEQAALLTPADGGPGDPALARAFDLRLSLEQIRRDRLAIQGLLREGSPDGVRVDALAMIGAVRESPQLGAALQEAQQKQAELRALRNRYTDQSAPVVRVRAELAALVDSAIPRMARALTTELARREGVTTPQVDSAFHTLREVPPLALREARLRRDVASAEELFTNVGQRYESARLALVSSLPDVRVLDAAVQPQRPASNYAPLLVALSFAGSFGLVVMGVTLRDRVDPKVRYPEQVTQTMRLPILGAVPHVSWRRAGAEGPAEVIEALRGLRIRVLHAHGVESPLTLTVTSPGAGEGKSFVSVNLALSFAYAGYQTLLIDGDVRRGAQHQVLDAPSRPGLTDVLGGDARIEQAVRKTTYAGLSFLPAGSPTLRAPELLLSPGLRALMGRLRKTFRVVIVDSPPLAAGVDPVVLGTVTGMLMMVLRSGISDMPLALSKLEVVDALPVHTIGVVLNDVRGASAFRYYTYDLSSYQAARLGATRRDGWPRILGGRS